MDTFLPTTLREAKEQGIREFDVIIVSADAYVDHPAFASAIIGRYLQSLGLAVGIIPQPDWHSTYDFTVLGRPRLFFGVTAGNLDSMVSLYTAQRKIRSDDPYSEHGKAGKRPFLPTVVYTNRIKQAYKDVPVIIGGIEASLRRIAHYEYYTDKVRPSILLDAKADMLIYGNGEAPLLEIVRRLKSNQNINQMKDIPGTAVIIKGKEKQSLPAHLVLPSYEQVKEKKGSFNRMTTTLFSNLNPYCASALYQDAGTRGVLINPPSLPLSTNGIDRIYALPFTRESHSMYSGRIPALDMIEYSVTAHRGCYGGCSFCSLYLHQGKTVQSRSHESIIGEIKHIAQLKGKAVTITDVGGPTANMYGTFCKDRKIEETCKRKSCIYPAICKNMSVSSKSYLALLKKLRDSPFVKNVYINSGIRYDIALTDTDFIRELTRHYTQGRLSVAPEHCSPRVLEIMQKPGAEVFEKFAQIFKEGSNRAHKHNFLMPYFIVGHPGADGGTENELRSFMKKHQADKKQIQEFYPTPMSIATAMYYTEMDPWTGKRIRSEKRLSVKKQWKR